MTAQRCPVCNGRGTVPAGFYHGPTTSANPDPCRSCDGRGYVVVADNPYRVIGACTISPRWGAT